MSPIGLSWKNEWQSIHFTGERQDTTVTRTGAPCMHLYISVILHIDILQFVVINKLLDCLPSGTNNLLHMRRLLYEHEK